VVATGSAVVPETVDIESAAVPEETVVAAKAVDVAEPVVDVAKPVVDVAEPTVAPADIEMADAETTVVPGAAAVPEETVAAPEIVDTLVAPDGASEKQYNDNFNYNYNSNTNSNGGYYGGRGYYGYGYDGGYNHEVKEPAVAERAIENALVPDPIIVGVDEYSQVVADRTNFYATAKPTDIGYVVVDC
jgi:hypothetical protein